MIRLLMLLVGSAVVRRGWRVVGALGIASIAIGALLIVDAIDGALYFPIHLFAVLVLIEGLVTLAAATSADGARRRLQQLRGAGLLALALLVLIPHGWGEVVVALIFGIAFLADGLLRIASAWVVRFAGWRTALAVGAAEVLFAAFVLEPWPNHYAGTIPYCLGVGLALAGGLLVRIAWRLRGLPPGGVLETLFARGRPDIRLPDTPPAVAGAPPQELIVHVWTPLGAADDPVRRPIVDRYIAAVDREGVISTGHAAVELAPDVYISHYPAADIDRSPDQFLHTLRATPDNDVAGHFQPSYAYESKAWCESTEQVVFRHFDAERLRAFWSVYRQDETYNLTNRNCSSTAVHALETALEGVLTKRRASVGFLVRAALSPELLAATQLRKRAETMAWTPGLVLDYARALHGVLHPPPVPLLTLPRLVSRALGRGSHDADPRR
jgi:uncharacterized membrane protein HdeD (DUF308 family)